MKSKVFSPHPCPILSNRLVPLNISNVAGKGFQGQCLEEENEARSWKRFSEAAAGHQLCLWHSPSRRSLQHRHLSCCLTTLHSSNWNGQAAGTRNYKLPGERKSQMAHRGEELSLLSSAIRLRTGSRSREGVEQHTPKEVVTCKGGRDRVLLLTDILNTEETETIGTKCFATEELSFSLSYCAAGVWWPSQYYIKYSNSFLVFRKGWNN